MYIDLKLQNVLPVEQDESKQYTFSSDFINTPI
jgi:hypothetical protein